MLKLLLSVLTLVVFGQLAFSQADSSLNNTSYAVSVTVNKPDGAIKSAPKDKIKFSDGKVSARFSLLAGFDDAVYTVLVDPNNSAKKTFAAESKNKKGQTIKWSGTIEGTKIRGEAKRIDPEDGTTTHLFIGELKN